MKRSDNVPTPGQTRRQFCGTACRAVSVLALAEALGSVLQSCGGASPTSPSNVQSLPEVNATEANSVITLAIDAASPLATVGNAALLHSSAGSLLLVARTAQDSFSALSATCTHQACTVSGYLSQTFVCPCHGSQFGFSGQVLSGPAVIALRQYHTQFAGGVLTITP